MIASVLILCAQAVPARPAPPHPAGALLEAMAGTFRGVERSEKGAAEGHIVARRLPGGLLVRDYWSETDGRRLYAGHDVLHFEPGGTVRHWWFGSRGDFAEARGTWSPEAVVLVVYDGDDPERRYTYRFPAGAAFQFTNEHAGRRGWEWFMDSAWQRAAFALPAGFQPPREPGGGFLDHYAGRFQGAEPCTGRELFGEWLVQEKPAGHGVMRSRAFGRLDLWLWDAAGRPVRLTGRKEREGALFELRDGQGRVMARRRDSFLPDGFRIIREDGAGRPQGPPREYRREPAPAR